MSRLTIALPVVLIASTQIAAAETTPDKSISAKQQEFFEKKIRPVLVQQCYECHSVDAKKLRGGLLLDSKPGWMKGGESGPVIVPGDPEESSIISALRYETFEMPPKAKLPAAVVVDFYEWIEMGAPDPRTEAPKAAANEEVFDLAERKKWWSLQPVSDADVPTVKDADWPRNDFDQFVLAGLEEKEWRPADPASRNSWLRRVTYDLTGLPPKPEELEAFLTDNKPDAHEQVVDRLLESKHFGEQWARHWMDLVRYAETKAFEADYPMPNAYQYRDYLIRAFNDDVPYNQMLREAIAGDLIEPRLNPQTGINESVIGTGYLYLTDGQHGPPDIHLDEARIFDDMIDVIGKAFLGQTVACARCHDHKFDAITTKDYYSLYGIIASSRIDYADINPPVAQAENRGRLREQKDLVRRELANVLAADMRRVVQDLQAVVEKKATTPQQKRWAEAIKNKPNAASRAIADLLATDDAKTIADRWGKIQSQQSDHANLGQLDRDSFGQWMTSGVSFGDGPRPAGDFVVASEGDNVVATFVGGRAAAGHLGSRFAGSIKSPRFTIEGNSVKVRVKGKNARVSLYVRHYELVGRGPTTGGTTKVINKNEWQTINFNTRLWVGEPAYIEVQQNGGEINFKFATDQHVDGSYALLDAAVVNRELPPLPNEREVWGLTGEAPDDRDQLIYVLASKVADAVVGWKSSTLSRQQSDLLQQLHEAGVFDFNINRSPELRDAVEHLRTMQTSIPKPTYVRSLCDGPGEDEPVYIRGSHRNRSKEPNPRHFMHAIDGEPFVARGSGRRQWVEALVHEDNPLTARVMANRVWHYLFDEGIVTSVDDFGHMGAEPANKALLDHLTKRFVQNGWSTKKLIRELVLSSTYRMSSNPSAESLENDPKNAMLQHMPVRRLQAESIRDTLLAVSGGLDDTLYGPSQGGDGGNRRSVYIQLRRRFMPEFLMTFDMPNATETFGRRNVTAGPTQSLALMNGEITWRAAERWADAMLSRKEMSFRDRVNLMHQQAFARNASDTELAWAEGLVKDIGADQEKLNKQQWKELCHTMLNRKELIYVY